MAKTINFGSEADQIRMRMRQIADRGAAAAKARGNFIGGAGAYIRPEDAGAYNQLQMQLMRLQRGVGGASGGIDPNAERAAMFDQTEGRAGRIETDPQIAAAMQAYQDVLSGQGLPFSDETVGRMQGQVADMNAAGAAAQQARLREQMAASGLGGPSADAASRSIDEQRALANQDSMRDMLIQQSIQNYEARQRAAQALASTRMGQFGLTNPLAMQAAQYHSQSYDEPRVAQQSFNFSAPAPRQSTPQQQQYQSQLPPMNHNYQVNHAYTTQPQATGGVPTPQPAPQQKNINNNMSVQYKNQVPQPAQQQGWYPGIGRQPTIEEWSAYQDARVKNLYGGG